MPLKVLIVGSFQPEDAASDADSVTSRRTSRAQRDDLLARKDVALRKEAFDAACREIGARLAERGDQIIVGSENPIDADPWVVAGAAQAKSTRSRVWVVQPARSGDDPYRDLRAQVDLVVKRLTGTWAAIQVSQIQLADAVIVIGGGYSTLTVGHAAPVLGRTMLALPWFGGAAYEVYDSHRDIYSRLESPDNPLLGWSRTYAATPDDVRSAIESLHLLHAQHVFSLRRVNPLIPALAMLVGTVLLMTVWILVFGYPDVTLIPIDGPARFFTLLAISAFFGVSLRNSLRVVFDPSYSHNVRGILAEIVCGLLLAFGLALLFLVGAITIVGDPKGVFVQSGADFERTAVVMTLLGLAGGLMIEQAADALRRWFGARLGDIAPNGR